MNKVVNDETSNLIILNQYIKDLSYENFQKNGTQNFNTKENNTNIENNLVTSTALYAHHATHGTHALESTV